MKVQIACLVAIVACSLVGVPIVYANRMDNIAFTGGILAFLVAPLLAGISQKKAYGSTTLSSLVLLLLCPAVYAFTDRFDAVFEKVRDGFFVATFGTIVFNASAWLASSLKPLRPPRLVISMLALLSSSVAIVILVWMVLYVE